MLQRPADGGCVRRETRSTAEAGGNRDFSYEEYNEVLAILEETGYDFDFFGEPGFLWAEVTVDGKEDYKDFMKEWKAGKEAYNL